jgi:hypothetical protein
MIQPDDYLVVDICLEMLWEFAQLAVQESEQQM